MACRAAVHAVLHSGDIFAAQGVPLIDEANGGSMLHIADSLMKAHDGIKNVNTIINGHTPSRTTWADLRGFADFNKDLVAWMQAELKACKTPEQAAAEWKLPEKYKGLLVHRRRPLRRPGRSTMGTVDSTAPPRSHQAIRMEDS